MFGKGKKEKVEKRFVEKFNDNEFAFTRRVIVDNSTGVNYLEIIAGSGVAITPLLGADGKVVIDEIGDNFVTIK